MAPGRCKWNFGWVIFKLTLVTDGWVISCEIPLSWMSLNLSDDKSILVQVMAWCRQATSHYLNQCWPRSMSPYGITRPQWVNSLAPERCRCNIRLVVFKLALKIGILRTFCEIASVNATRLVNIGSGNTGDPLHSRALAHSRAPLFTQPCPGRTMSTAVCIYVAGLCASCPAV